MFLIAVAGIVAMSASGLIASTPESRRVAVQVSPFDPAAGTSAYFPAQFPERGTHGETFDAPTF
jgi:hypothetical protein